MKTKSYLFAAASATLMLASCTQNEVVEMPATRAIGFGTYVGNTSRAAAEDTSLDFLKDETKGNGFYVFGSYMDGAIEIHVFDGKSDQSHVTHTGSSWAYAPINYWLVGKQYRFVAYGPAAASTNGTATFEYATNTLSVKGFEATGNLDLVVAEGNNNNHDYTLASETATMESVKFKFFHALSKVRFTFKNGWRNLVTLKVTNVKLTGVKRTGDLVTTGDLADANAPFALSQWSNQAVKADGNDYTWKKENGDDDTFSSTKTNDTYPYEYFLMPQALEADAIKLTFTCQVNNNQGGGPDLGEGAGKPVDVSVTIPVTTNVSAWEPGKAYNYTLTIDGDLFGLKPIQFDTVDMVEWVDVNEDLGKEDLTPKP